MTSSRREINKLMENGNMYECALERCKELMKHYEEKLMDYTKLSMLLSRMAVCYASITDPTKVRPEPEYFRVAYYGKGFPGFLQNKVFVYRGHSFERLTEFQSRLLDQFPDAELLTKLEEPEKEKKESAEQYIQVNKVDCVVTENKFTSPGVSQHIRKFYLHNMVRKFMYSRPYHEGIRIKDNEFATLCVERTTLTLTYDLPGILRCFPCVSTKTVKLRPLEYAIDQMRAKNKALEDLVVSHELHPQQHALDSLTRELNGIVDAAVMGGIANYEKAFLQDAYLEAHPEDAELLDQLKALIRDMVSCWTK
ncbi:hypothetical protein HAZT_HAZT001525 [Hyalella azteca]|uniref:DOCKER domain-containing protein n=1 Tax=Hyalella azteca TaxID=294128 RepID=A0A6A0GUB0_HYAAZ|nr:hypothetical protein HAZT_HAZT001525 [Hyalella azteca]